MSQLIVCWTTVAFRNDAHKIATALLEEKLAACVQVDGPTQSHYRWKGEQLCDEEHRLWIKSTAARWEALRSRLKELHPYEEPQILMAEIAGTSDGYASWVVGECA